MSFGEIVLYQLAKHWPRNKDVASKFAAYVNEAEHFQRYARYEQFDRYPNSGIPVDVLGKEVLEVGCSSGGLSRSDGHA